MPGNVPTLDESFTSEELLSAVRALMPTRALAPAG
jgi:hypothetical protein